MRKNRKIKDYQVAFLFEKLRRLAILRNDLQYYTDRCKYLDPSGAPALHHVRDRLRKTYSKQRGSLLNHVTLNVELFPEKIY